MNKILNIIIFGLLLLIFGSYMFTFQVRQDEIAFVNTLGENSEPYEEPGLRFKWPWPIQHVYKFDKRIHVTTTRYDQVMTKNNESVMMQFYFGWRISDPGIFMSKTQGSDSVERMKHAERQLLEFVDTEKNNQVNAIATGWGDFVSKTGSEIGNDVDFDQLEGEILEAANHKASDIGMEIQFVGVRKVGLPQSNLSEVLDTMVSQWSSETETAAHIAQQRASTIRETAQNDRDTALLKAQAEASATLAAAQADALQQFQLLEKDPKLAAFLMQLDALEKSVRKQTTLILDDSMGPFGLLRGLKSPEDSGSN